jgi:hypothetical protein
MLGGAAAAADKAGPSAAATDAAVAQLGAQLASPVDDAAAAAARKVAEAEQAKRAAVAALTGNILFMHLSHSEKCLLCQTMQSVAVQKDHVVIRQGESPPTGKFYIVESGKFDVYVEQKRKYGSARKYSSSSRQDRARERARSSRRDAQRAGPTVLLNAQGKPRGIGSLVHCYEHKARFHPRCVRVCMQTPRVFRQQ